MILFIFVVIACAIVFGTLPGLVTLDAKMWLFAKVVTILVLLYWLYTIVVSQGFHFTH
jgi:hypothetical protein